MAISGKAWSVLVLILSFYPVAGLTATNADIPISPPANKFTLAYYNFSSGKQGFDINLRHTFKTSTAWIAGYGESGGFDQVREGYEYDYHRDWLTFVPSAQAATHGFLGASVYGEVGHRFFGIAGAGRTNLHTYWNLGFDPNETSSLAPGIATMRAVRFLFTPFEITA